MCLGVSPSRRRDCGADQADAGLEDNGYREPLGQRPHSALVAKRVEKGAVSESWQDLRRNAAAEEDASAG